MTDRIEALRALKAKVEPGECPWIAEAFETGSWFDPDSMKRAQKAFSGSLDAARVLHEAVLPGWLWTNGAVPETEFGQGSSRLCFVWPNDPNSHLTKYRPSGKNPDPARAWLIAILSALIANAATP